MVNLAAAGRDVDSSSFFTYPTPDRQPDVPGGGDAALGLLPRASAREWDLVLQATRTRRLRSGEALYAAGELDRALYVLIAGSVCVVNPDGRAVGEAIDAPAVLGELGFLGGEARTVSVRAVAAAEVLRLGFDAWEALNARYPQLGRDLLLDVGRLAAARGLAGPAPPRGWAG